MCQPFKAVITKERGIETRIGNVDDLDAVIVGFIHGGLFQTASAIALLPDGSLVARDLNQVCANASDICFEIDAIVEE